MTSPRQATSTQISRGWTTQSYCWCESSKDYGPKSAPLKWCQSTGSIFGRLVGVVSPGVPRVWMVQIMGGNPARFAFRHVGIIHHDGTKSVVPFFGDVEQVQMLLHDIRQLGFQCHVESGCEVEN